ASVLGEQLGPGVLRVVLGDGEGAIRSGTFGMHASLGDHLAIEVSELLQEPNVLQQLWPTWPGGHHVLVVHHRTARNGRQLLLVLLVLFFRLSLFVLHQCCSLGGCKDGSYRSTALSGSFHKVTTFHCLRA